MIIHEGEDLRDLALNLCHSAAGKRKRCGWEEKTVRPERGNSAAEKEERCVRKSGE